LAMQNRIFRVSASEQGRNLCSVCMGHRRLCGNGICPIRERAEALMKLEKSLSKKNIFGSSPPAVFVGSWNYPKVLAGPLVPPILEDTSAMDLPEKWLSKSFEEILSYRLQLVRGERFTDVKSAANPDRITSTFQEIVMASKPIDTEMWFSKKPRLTLSFSPREPPSGPSASITRAVLAENPSTPPAVDHVVSDTDLKADQGILTLYNSKVSQQQITRMLSIGLLGVGKERRLVPTEWSITAIDDILGRKLHREILSYSWINQFMVFGHKALANNIQILLFPSSWMFEAQEAWLSSANPTPDINYELIHGRQSYASNLAGAYYAVRLPVLEYLKQIRRQAGAIVLMEVYPDWIPLGVWRFREICREALKKTPVIVNTLEEALGEMSARLRLNLEKWLERSKILRSFKEQTRLTSYIDAERSLKT
jgi:hypothetical protein